LTAPLAPEQNMTNNTTVQRLLSSDAKWRPTWSNPVTMTQTRKYGSSISTSLMMVTFSTHHHILPTLLTPNITSHTHGPRWEPSRLLGLLIEGGIRFATVNNAGHRATSDSVRSNLVLRSLDTVSDRGNVAVIYHTGKFGESRDKQVLICMARLRISSYG
jgi:hypothetical protein